MKSTIKKLTILGPDNKKQSINVTEFALKDDLDKEVSRAKGIEDETKQGLDKTNKQLSNTISKLDNNEDVVTYALENLRLVIGAETNSELDLSETNNFSDCTTLKDVIKRIDELFDELLSKEE